MSKEQDQPSDTVQSSRRGFLSGASAVGSAAILAASTIPSAEAAQKDANAMPSASSADQLRKLLVAPEPIVAPIVYDLMSAKLAKHLGFPVITLGGSAVSSGMYGMGDYGMATVSELIEFAARLAEGVDLPLIADADDCGGNPLNVYRAIKRYARADVASVLIEDMSGAKHVPGRPEGRLISMAEMVDKIKAGVDAAGPGGPVILGRCDAMAKNLPFEKALERSVAYSEAGAEMIFVSGASPEQHAQVADATGKAVFSTGGGKNTADVLAAHKVKVSAFAIEPYALKAVHQALLDLQQHGSPSRTVKGLPREITTQLHDAEHWATLSEKYNAQSY